MREIKFRGIRIDNGKWVYGELIAEEYPLFLRLKKPLIFDISGVWEVDIKTVGQYTGLKDKNNKEIYEGDIIKYTHDWEVWPEKSTALVEFKKGGFEPLSLASGGVYYGIGSPPVYEVLGNIYENPELLKEVE